MSKKKSLTSALKSGRVPKSLAGFDLAKADRDGWFPLLTAAHRGNTDFVRALLDAGADPNQADEHGLTPLHVAVHHPEILTLLLEAGSSTCAVTGAGHTALTTAVRLGAPIDALLAAGAAPGLALHFADEATATALIASGAPVDGLYDVPIIDVLGLPHDRVGGWNFLVDIERIEDLPRVLTTPVVTAAGQGRVAVFHALCAAGADSAGPTGGLTALHAAAGGGHVGIVETLLQQGCDMGELRYGVTPLQLALRGGRAACAKALIDARAPLPDTAAFLAVESEEIETLRVSLAAGADPNALNWYEHPPIDKAVKRGLLPFVELLLQAGAAVDGVGAGDTPLSEAAHLRHPEMVACLLQAGANVNARGYKERTPLHRAREPETAALLLAAGADPDAVDSDERMPKTWPASVG